LKVIGELGPKGGLYLAEKNFAVQSAVGYYDMMLLLGQKISCRNCTKSLFWSY
jgi:hypothetical protein